MRKQLVMGNWKMNGDKTSIAVLLHDLIDALSQREQANCVVFPPFIYLPLVAQALKSGGIHLGAQNVYPASQGALTGEVSGPMLTDYQCRYVLVGHSERRQLFRESKEFVAKKFHHVKEHGMIPVLCVGETLEEREKGLTDVVIGAQLDAVLDGVTAAFQKCVIAYEPVWAIGTGQTASPDVAEKVHQFIRGFIAEHEKTQEVTIVYGGSVNERNARELFAMPNIDGGLVGGASLNTRQFVEIVKCIS